MSSTSFRKAAREAGTPECFTCGACSSACPLTGERSTFDPRFIFRMVNLGLAEELLRSPCIWLCEQCGRSTEACPQGVDGCRMIASLWELAVQEGKVHADFALQAEDAQKLAYRRWVDDVDRLFGFAESRVKYFSCPVPIAECV